VSDPGNVVPEEGPAPEEGVEEIARLAGLAAGAAPRSTARLGDVAAELERRLQDDRRASLPDEPILRSGPSWGRWVKRAMYETLRPVTRRYDRITASLATLATSTAQRLEDLEAEVARLRRLVEEADPTRSPGDPVPHSDPPATGATSRGEPPSA